MSNENLRRLRETIQKRATRPSGEQYQEMVERGAIDGMGNVTIRRPLDPDPIPLVSTGSDGDNPQSRANP
jgi:hypothetical protein